MNSNFFLTHTIDSISSKISYNSKIISLGSCFSDNIGNKLLDSCFNIVVNPFGVLFNPASVCKSLKYIIDNKRFTEKDIFQNGSLWSSFAHSTLFSSPNKEECLNLINSQIQQAHNQIINLDFLLLTFGTSWIFELKETGDIVANCHKLPSDLFVRRRLRVDEIIEQYSVIIENLRNLNPNLEIIFTVSPVRHWKDGAHENNISKGILHIAIDSLCKRYNFTNYFPAYEIQIDELRDYRFYADDMVHPSTQTVNYIWQKFIEYCIDKDEVLIMQRIEEIKSLENHRPIHTDIPEYVQLKHLIESKKNLIIKDFPFLNSRLK